MNNLIKKLLRKAIVQKYRILNKNKNVTIISQNCIGGVIYSDLNLPFQSPTINMFIEDENFVKLVENIEYYMSLDPDAIEDAFHEGDLVYPKIAVGDIELCCLHYKNCNEAINAWNRRKNRINYNNIVVIANSWNLHNQKEYFTRIVKAGYKTVIFTLDNNELPECVQLPDWGKFMLDERGIVRPNITDMIPNSPYVYFEKFFDFVGWLNSNG